MSTPVFPASFFDRKSESLVDLPIQFIKQPLATASWSKVSLNFTVPFLFAKSLEPTDDLAPLAVGELLNCSLDCFDRHNLNIARFRLGSKACQMVA